MIGTFDALPRANEKPHAHGTGIAGAIAVAANACSAPRRTRICSRVRAFGASGGSATPPAFNILKGLE